MQTTENIINNNRKNNSFQKIMAFILISVVIIVCCLCLIFAIIFTKILKNHKKAMNTIAKPVIKSIDMSQINTIPSQPLPTNSTIITVTDATPTNCNNIFIKKYNRRNE